MKRNLICLLQFLVAGYNGTADGLSASPGTCASRNVNFKTTDVPAGPRCWWW